MATKSPVTPEEVTDELIFAELMSQGFKDIDGTKRRRVVASIEGKEGTGKTFLACTADGPIIYFDIDIGTEGVVEQFQDGSNGITPRRILRKRIRIPKGESKDTYESLWNEVWQMAETAYKLKRGAVIWDTGSELYELCRLARYGKLAQVPPHYYQLANNDWRDFARLAYDSDMSTILIHKVKPVWVNNNRTNEYEPSGFSETPYMVQVRLSTFRNQTDDGAVFGFKILKCRPKDSLVGETVAGPMSSFPFLLNLIYGKEAKK